MKPVPVEDIPGVPAFIQQKPLGVVGVIGAWNFPLILTIQPALAALAAGNRVMIKFPELEVRTGQVVAEAVAKYFSEDELVVIVGDLETAQAFSALQLDHIIFTGSPAIGKVVAAAAGQNLVPVTLELGGKNPVVVARDADLDLAAQRIAGTRMMNSGQICLCPDYVFVAREQGEEFIAKLRNELTTLFPDYLDNPGAVSIVNDRNYDRIIGLIDDATAKGATKIQVVNEAEAAALPSREKRLIPPTILLNVPAEATISEEEIFGPVLPVYLYDDIQEVINYVSTRPSPLGTYWYGQDSREFQHYLHFTTSGGVTRNDGVVHAFRKGTPFGGVGNSGTGAYHGKSGFDQFTHRRPVVSSELPASISAGMVGAGLESDEVKAGIDQAIAGAIAEVRARIGN
jgi:coniferyl-aldehyde dehydrogenase